MPGASPLPIGGSPFDGRYSGCGLSSIHGIPSSSAAIPPQAVMTSDTTRSSPIACSCGTVQHRHPGRALVDLGTGVAVVVVLGGVEPGQFDGVDTGGARGFQPLGTGQQRGVVAGGHEPLTQRDGRKRVSGVRPGHHRDAHRSTLPQRLG